MNLVAVMLGCGLAAALATPGDAWAQEAAAQTPAWRVDERGRRFRVVFDPGQRLFAGVGTDGVQVGLSLRAEAPPAHAEVFWKRDHQIVHLRLRPEADGLRSEGWLYRGVFLRHSRQGLLTIATTPPLRVPLPFDVGVRVGLGQLSGSLSPGAEANAMYVSVMRGEAMADFLRSERPGRWLSIGVAGTYDVRFGAAGSPAPEREHRIAPLTAVTGSGRFESARGLLAAECNVELTRAWSSSAGWQTQARADGDIEVTPLAINDLPLSMVVGATVAHGQAAGSVQWTAFVGVRMARPLR